uniref:Ubiquitin-like protease family profile domain-containing protein n=1 Tax=Trichuris muris TaxID=70415 RepID=A0A5S6QFG9_TRIMR
MVVKDILSLEVPDWVTNPFSAVENAGLQLQEELLELQANEELKSKFNLDTEPSGCNAISHASTQDCGLYVVADLLTKKRNKLQIVNQGDLRLRLTSIEPNIEKLLSLRGFQV